MRLILLIALAALPALSAQSIETAHDLRREADRHVQQKEYESARVKLRDAALIARSIENPELEVTCLTRLGQILRWSDTGIRNDEAAFRLLGTALTVSTHAGLREQELKVLGLLRGRSLDDWKANVDAALAWGDLGTFEVLWDLTNRLDVDNKEERVAYLDKGIELADERARLRHKTGTTPPPKEAAKLITELSGRIEEAGFPRLSLAVLEDRRDHFPEVALARLERLQSTERYRDLAEAIGESTSLNPSEEEYAKSEELLLRAYRYAGTARDLDLQLSLAGKLHALTSSDRWTGIADVLRQRRLWELIAEGRRAVRDSWFLHDGLLETLEAHAGDPEVDEILLLLRGKPEPRSAEDREHYAEALKAALQDEQLRNSAAVLAEIAGREEGFQVLVDALAEEKNPSEFAWAIETLAGQDDVETLLGLLDHKDWMVKEAAAAALFRLDTSAHTERIMAATSNDPFSGSTLYLLGCLVKSGMPPGLFMLEREAEKAKDGRRALAAGILADLGYVSPIPTFHELVDKEKVSGVVPRALSRMPRYWGARLVYNSAKGSDLHAARAAFRRGDPDRARNLSVRGLHPNIYRMPSAEENGADAGNFDMMMVNDAQGSERDETRDMINWAADRAGNQGAEVNDALAPPEEGEENPLRRLARTERETATEPGGNRKRIVIIDIDGSGFARCAIQFEVGTAEIVDNKLHIPYRMEIKINAVGGGLAGVLYREVIIAMAASDVRDGAKVKIPGYEPVDAGFTSGPEGWGTIVAPLPYKDLGEGLGDATPAPLEDVVQGQLRVLFDFNGNAGKMQFPLQFIAPPEGDKPDLVPESLTLDPPVPEIGQSARVFLRVKNNGKAVGDVAVSSVRFMIRNPQSEEGWRTLDARVFSPKGWRPGEVRTFEVRPRFVEGYYMNTYSYTYTPALGDTTLRAEVDPDNTVKEMEEENNGIEIESPLQLDEERGAALAEAEALEALKQPAEDLKTAETMEELAAAYDRAWSIFERLKKKTPAVEIMLRHLYASYEMKEARLRAEKALKELKEARDSGTLDRHKARRLRNELLRAQESFLRSGVPIKIETLEKARNATLVAANLPAAVDDYHQLNYALNRYATDDSPVGNATRYLKGLDGAMLAFTEAQRAREKGEVDAGNLMDAASNAADALDLKMPGFSNLHRELLKAELEYADKGMRKEADAIEALSAVIAGEEGAEERLNQAVGEVERHVSAGPFTEESMKNIVKGWVKDIPVVGQIADIIFSWK